MWEQVGLRIQKWEQKSHQVDTKWDQEGQSNPKWKQKCHQVRTKWDQESKSGNRRATKQEQSGIKNLKVGTEEPPSGNK